MTRLAPAALLLVLAAASSTSGCASSCTATPAKLASLTRGMSYGEATGVMGCKGLQITPNGPESPEVSTVQWRGPNPGLVSRTELDFRDGHLLSFSTGNAGGW
jgi:hypothetical protein